MTDKRARNEIIKENSRQLRGTLLDGLSHAETGAIAEDDTQLLKFHGSYMQDDRDVRGERAKKKLEKAFSFMIRLRIPELTQDRRKEMVKVAHKYAEGARVAVRHIRRDGLRPRKWRQR